LKILKIANWLTLLELVKLSGTFRYAATACGLEQQRLFLVAGLD
jgi:hypothetical protein